MEAGIKMDILNGLQLVTNLGEATIIAVIAMGLTNLLKKTPLPNWTMPIYSMVFGAIVGVIIGLIFNDTNLANSGLYGFLVGGFASGVFQFVKAGVNNNPSNSTSNEYITTSNVVTPDKQNNKSESKLDTNKNVLQSQMAMKDEPQQIK